MKQEYSISSFLVLERGFRVGLNWVSTNVEQHLHDTWQNMEENQNILLECALYLLH